MQLTLTQLLDQFVATKQTEGRTPKTVSWYHDMVKRFVLYVTNGSEATLSEFTLENARSFVASLQGQSCRYENHPNREKVEGGLSPNTVHAYVRAMKAFSAWLGVEGYTKADVLSRLKRPKLPETMIQILSDDEINNLLDSINYNTFQGARQYLIILLLLDTGGRADELVNIKLENIDMEDEQIKVMGKGRKERLVPFAKNTKKHLQRYLTTWRPESESEYLLLSQDGTPMTYEGLSHTVKRLGINAGIPRLHAHLLRHTFAVKYLMNGGDIMSLKRILGHVTLDVTQLYLHLADTHIKTQHSKFSPVDRLLVKRR